MHFTSTGVSHKLSYASSVWQQEPTFHRFLAKLIKVEQKAPPPKTQALGLEFELSLRMGPEFTFELQAGLGWWCLAGCVQNWLPS